MGTSILGWVEISPGGNFWEGILKINGLLGRHRFGFGSIFIDEGYFPPIVEGRGLPNDISEEVKRDDPIDGGNWGHTWADWDEITVINWDEEYEFPSPFIQKHIRDGVGNWVFDSAGEIAQLDDLPDLDFSDTKHIELDNVLYTVVDLPKIRRDTLGWGWDTIFKIMSILAETGDHKGIRLIIWFNG